MDSLPILSRNAAFEQLSAWLSHVTLEPDFSVRIAKDDWEHGKLLSLRLAEQILDDPRTEAFLMSQTVDYHALLKVHGSVQSWSVPHVQKLHHAISEHANPTVEQQARHDFVQQGLAQVWNADDAHRTSVAFVQAVTQTQDEFVAHLLAKLYLEACFQRMHTFSVLIHSLFWHARMTRCARLGYFSEKPLATVPVLPTLSSIDAPPPIDPSQLNRFNLSSEQASHIVWTPTPGGWKTSQGSFSPSTYSTKWFPQEALFFAEHGRLYGFRCPSLPVRERELFLSSDGVLSSEPLHTLQVAPLEVEGLLSRKRLGSAHYTVCVDALPSHVAQALEEGYARLAKDALDDTTSMDALEAWAEKHHTKVHALVVVHRLPQPLQDWIESTFQNLTPVQKTTFLGHQFVLLHRTLKAHYS